MLAQGGQNVLIERKNVVDTGEETWKQRERDEEGGVKVKGNRHTEMKNCASQRYEDERKCVAISEREKARETVVEN